MTDALRALCAQYDMLPRGALVLCAVSGGADSMCLLHLLHTMAQTEGFCLRAAHFNHKLRGEESDRDEQFVRAWCLEQDIPLTCGSADVGEQAARTGRGVEETARALRYAFLEQTAAALDAKRIATAHTADDNAETMLLNLVRGAGLQGLTGIPPRRGNVVRPLLNATRAQVEQYCAVHGVPFVVDSTNSDESYTRNYLRAQIMPRLKQMNPRAAENLSAAAGRLRVDHDYLNELTRQAMEDMKPTWEGSALVIRSVKLGQLPDPIASRAARMLLEHAGGGKSCTAAHLEGLLNLCRSEDPSGKLALPGLTARREYDKLLLAAPEGPAFLPEPVPVREGEQTCFGGWLLACNRTVCLEENSKNPDTFFLACDRIKGAITLRPRQTGDRIKLPGRGSKTVKKLMIDEKVPLDRRELLPVLADDAGVLAVAGFGPEVSRLALVGEEAFKITFEKRKSE